MRKHRVLVCGNPTIDEIPRTSHRRRILPGGGVFYAGTACGLFGPTVTMVGNIGNDYPSYPRRWLNSHGILVKFRTVNRAKTTRFRLGYTGEHRKLILLHNAPILDSIPNQHFNAVHLASVFNEISPNLVKNARQRTTLLSADLQGFVRTVSDDGTVKNVRRDLRYLFHTCDLVKASQSEAEIQFQTMNRKMILRRMLREGLQYALLTLGKKGCLIATRESNRMWHVPAFLDPQVKDPTGAGDILIGCWLSIYLELQDPVWATSVGSALSSLTSRRLGLSKFSFSRYELFRRASWVYNRVKESTLS